MEKKYLVEESHLTSIADIIRNKTGLTNKLTFPDQFFEEIRNIETSPATALPVLDMNYPEDVVAIEGLNVSANFNVVITEPGVPAVYSYQWYFNGEAVEGANSSSFSINQEITKGTYNVYCEVTNEAGVIISRIGSLVVESYLPEFTYNGVYELIEDGNYNWRIKFLTSGVLTFQKVEDTIDVFLVGGGGGGGVPSGNQGSSGGGGGYTFMSTKIISDIEEEFEIQIGGGGSTRGTGGTTTAFGFSVNGGGPGTNASDGAIGGTGGSGGGAGLHNSGGHDGGGDGGSDGGNGGDALRFLSNVVAKGGTGQGTTTREFHEETGDLYAGGGGGGGADKAGVGGAGGGGDSGKSGTANTGGGGGNQAAGGSGVAVIRNHRS